MCAVFGLIDYGKVFSSRQREKILRVLSEECEERGTDATGYAFNKAERLAVYKRPLPAHEMNLKLPEEANVILGHTRMATQGDKKQNCNNHPFAGIVGGIPFALAHNGIIDDIQLRNELQLPATKIKTDSYIAVQLLERQKSLDLTSIKEMAEKIRGTFVFTILDRQNDSYFVRGNNPLALYHYENYGFYIYASTDVILTRALKKLGILNYPHKEILTDCGDIIRIDKKGELTECKFDTSGLMSDYGYYPDWWYGGGNSAEMQKLFDYAYRNGITEEEIELLLDYGYFPEEIMEMMYTQNEIHTAIRFVMEDFGYSCNMGGDI